jgi:hypothetical protein
MVASEVHAMSDDAAQNDPMDRAYSLVGRFLYHYGRIEQKIDQAIIKLLELDEKVALLVTISMDFAKKVNLLEQSALAQANNDDDKKFVDKTSSRVFKINTRRVIVVHSFFEPAIGGGVQFGLHPVPKTPS